MGDLFYSDMTRDECCRFYADVQGRKYDFTDKDWAWVSEYEYATKRKDEDLLYWLQVQLG